MADVTLKDGRSLSSLRVSDLKEELAKLGLPQKGNKADLTERLREALLAQQNVPGKNDTSIPQEDGAGEQPQPDSEPTSERADNVDGNATAEQQMNVSTGANVSLDPAEEEEEEERLDYGGDSMIVSTAVEDDAADNILGASNSSTAVNVSKSSDKPREESKETEPSPTTPGRLSLRRSRDVDPETAAQNRKRRWTGSDQATSSNGDRDVELPAKVAKSGSSSDIAGSSSRSSVHQRLGPVEVPAESSSSGASEAERDHPASPKMASPRRRMEQEIALQEEAEQKRLKHLREQDALRRQQLLGKGTAAEGSAATDAAAAPISGRSVSSSSDTRHNAAAPGVSRTLSTNAGTASEPIPASGDAAPSQQSASCTISIHGLVRPFTLPQLKELLSRHGPIVPDGFWIDRIKSHCYVSFEEVGSAEECRKALHGARWPTTSPRTLSVDFADPTLITVETNNQMSVRMADGTSVSVTTSSVSAKAAYASGRSAPATDTDGRRSDHPRADRNIDLQARRAAREQRERDRQSERDGERRSSSQSKSGDRKVPAPELGSRDRPHVVEHEESQAANVLDQLFRKTNTLPALYWLPLTDEQAKEKELAEKKRKAAATAAAPPPSSSSSRRRSRSRSPPSRRH
eukprot:scpid5379/ scgid15943/ Apoptotic chromatin condensation inducer in the nucleus